MSADCLPSRINTRNRQREVAIFDQDLTSPGAPTGSVTSEKAGVAPRGRAKKPDLSVLMKGHERSS